MQDNTVNTRIEWINHSTYLYIFTDRRSYRVPRWHEQQVWGRGREGQVTHAVSGRSHQQVLFFSRHDTSKGVEEGIKSSAWSVESEWWASSQVKQMVVIAVTFHHSAITLHHSLTHSLTRSLNQDTIVSFGVTLEGCREVPRRVVRVGQEGRVTRERW